MRTSDLPVFVCWLPLLPFSASGYFHLFWFSWFAMLKICGRSCGRARGSRRTVTTVRAAATAASSSDGATTAAFDTDPSNRDYSLFYSNRGVL